MTGRGTLTPSAAVATALAASNLRSLPTQTLDRLTADATLLRIPAGSIMRRAGDVGGHIELVVDGLIRIFVTAPDGRTLTIRYCRRGDLMGMVSLFRDAYRMPGSIGAVTDSEVLSIRPTAIRALVDTELAVAHAVNDELAARVAMFASEIPRTVFASVRQRIAQHLLDLASEHRAGPELVAPISQQQLADAVGTVREVIVRVLRDLREEGLVETRRDGIRVIEPETLLAQMFVTEGGTQVPRDGEPGR